MALAQNPWAGGYSDTNYTTSSGQVLSPSQVYGKPGPVATPPPAPKPPAPTGDPNANKAGYFRNEFGVWTPIGPPSGPSMEELNSAYDPLLGYLSQAESQLRTDFPTYTEDINRAADTSKQTLGNNYASTTQQLSNQGEQGAKQKDNVIAAAQRLYQELQQANLQRFGAGGTGQFASELQGRELQGNTNNAQTQYTNLVQQLGQKKIEVDAAYQTGLKQIEDQRLASINEVNRMFQDKLSQINQQRGAVESQKAQQRLDALQQYRQQVYQIQLQNYQLQQQAQSNYTSQQSQLQQYLEKLSSGAQAGTDAFNQYNSSAITDPNSQFAPQSTQQGGDMSQYYGQISPTPKKSLYDMPAFSPTG